MLIIDPVFCKAIDQQRFQVGIETGKFRGPHRLGQPGPEAQGARLHPYRRPVCANGLIVAAGVVQRIGKVVMGRGVSGLNLYSSLETRNCGGRFLLAVQHDRLVVQSLGIARVD